MSASQQTTNYGFPKFLGTDKPAWLVDFNGAMDEIDSTIKTVADLLSTLSGTVDANTADIAQLITDLTTAQGTLTTLQGIVSQNVLDITANEIAIETANSDIDLLTSGKADKPSLVNTSLLALSWVGSASPYTLDLSVANVSATSIQQLKIALSASSAEITAFQNAIVLDNGQTEGHMLLKAIGDKPTIDIPVTIMLQGEPHA